MGRYVVKLSLASYEGHLSYEQVCALKNLFKDAQVFKKCAQCGDVFSLDFFYNNKSAKDGKDEICKQCRKVKESRYNISHKFERMLTMVRRRAKVQGVECLVTVQELRELWIYWQADLLRKPELIRVNLEEGYVKDNIKFVDYFLTRQGSNFKRKR